MKFVLAVVSLTALSVQRGAFAEDASAPASYLAALSDASRLRGGDAVAYKINKVSALLQGGHPAAGADRGWAPQDARPEDAPALAAEGDAVAYKIKKVSDLADRGEVSQDARPEDAPALAAEGDAVAYKIKKVSDLADRGEVSQDARPEDAPALAAEPSDEGRDEAGSGVAASVAPEVWYYEYPTAAWLDKFATSSSTTFEYKGEGFCADVNGHSYQSYSPGDTGTAIECQDLCLGAGKFEILVGFDWDPDSTACDCDYDRAFFADQDGLPADWNGAMGAPQVGTQRWRCYARRYTILQ